MCCEISLVLFEFMGPSRVEVRTHAYIASATAKLQTVGNHSTAKLEWCLSYEFGISQAETFGRRRKGELMNVPSRSSLSSAHTGCNPMSRTSYHPPLAKWRVSQTFFRFIVAGGLPSRMCGHRYPSRTPAWVRYTPKTQLGKKYSM
jgi:hypothetical protein